MGKMARTCTSPILEGIIHSMITSNNTIDNNPRKRKTSLLALYRKKRNKQKQAPYKDIKFGHWGNG